MPTIRYMSWNIQNFGSNGPVYQLCKGQNSWLLAQFIAAVVKDYEIDILGVMEVFPDSQAHLDNVAIALNNVMGVQDWCYDWIKSTVVGGYPPAANIDSPDKLGWSSGARREGYAVFWRNEQREKFKMVDLSPQLSEGTRKSTAYNPDYLPTNALSLSLNGRVIGADGYLASNFNEGAPAAGWENSCFPPTSVGDPDKPCWRNTRRPCYCLIEMNIPGAGNKAKLVPIMLYHAPSYSSRARIGTFISGLSRELYAIHDLGVSTNPLIAQQKVIASGDYNANISGGIIWYNDYYSYYNPFNQMLGTTHVGGADCTPLYNDTQAGNFKSTIQLNKSRNGLFLGDPIMSDNVADYLFLPIDNMFYRGLTLPGGAADFFRVNLVEDVMADDPNSYIMDGIKAYFGHLNNLVVEVVANMGSVAHLKGLLEQDGSPIFTFMEDWDNFFQGVQNGYFTHARSAAEFIRMFVSDHLPIIITFEVA